MALINIGTLPNDGTGDDLRTAFTKVNANNLDNVIVVKKASDFFPIDNTKVYFLDGIIDMGTTEINYSGNLTIVGNSFETSGLFSGEDNYTMFTSSDSGNLYLRNLSLQVSSSINSRTFALTSATGFEAIEMLSVNFLETYDLGYFDNFRQGFESGTGRFEFECTLEFRGNWLGGYVVNDSIGRNLDGTVLFKAGTGLVFNSRFKSNMNVDLGLGMSLLDFSPTNFSKPNLLQLDGCIVTVDGVVDPDNTDLTPNISESDLQSSWRNNIGLKNTMKGGVMTITTESTTALTLNNWVDIAGTFTITKEQHFSQSTNQIVNDEDTPVDVNLMGVFLIDGTANDVIEIRAVILRDATATDEPQEAFRTVINSNLGGTDVGTITMFDSFNLKSSDSVRMQVRNITSNNDVIIEETSSKFRLDAK